MEKRFGVTGEERKRLVSVIAKFTGEKSRYLGMPTAAYEIGSYMVTKEGTLVSQENADGVEELLRILEQEGFVDADAEELEEENILEESISEDENEEGVVAESNLEENVSEESADIECFLEETAEVEDTQETEGEEVHTEVSENLECGAEEYEENCDETKNETVEEVILEEETQADEIVDNIAEESSEEILIISMPKNEFTERSLENLKKIVESKGNLMKKVFQTEELPIIITEEKVNFPWFKKENLLSAPTYMKFITAICDMAKNQKRITAKAKVNENEKYAFRCFLLRLGFIGDEFKQDRKILLKNLEGSSAFKHEKRKEDVAE